MKKTGIETISVNGINFTIGYTSNCEFSGYVFEMTKDGKKYGALWVDKENRKLGYDGNVYATDDEISAIEIAKSIMKEKYGDNRFHG